VNGMPSVVSMDLVIYLGDNVLYKVKEIFFTPLR
jgi:hypothetical protein